MEHRSLIFATLILVVPSCDHSKPVQQEDALAQTDVDRAKMNHAWPFSDPRNHAVITLDRIMDGTHSILYVTHDADDGGWQFLDGGDVTEDDAMVVSLREIVEYDSTILQLGDMPRGWYAVRDAIDKPWKRGQRSQ